MISNGSPKARLIWQVTAILLLCERLTAQEVQPPVPSSAEEVRSEIKRLTDEIAKLSSSPDAPPGWKELRRLKVAIEASRQRGLAEAEPLRDRSAELYQTPPVADWNARISRLSQRLAILQDEDRRLTLDAGAELFRVRHAELAKQGAAQTPQLRGLGFDVLSYPRVDGSTSTQPLAMLIACRCFGVPYAWTGRAQHRPDVEREKENYGRSDLELLFANYGLPDPKADLYEFTLRAQAEGAANERLALIINGLLAANASTHRAYVNLIEGKSDLGLLARPPSPAELELAKERNVAIEATPCALDAFVFLVNSGNQLRHLTTAQIQDIYSGKVTSWSDVGGANEAITAYQREESSGSQQLMRTLVMKDVPLYKPTGKYERAPQLIGSLMGSTYLELTYNAKGLGYSVYYYEQFMSGSPRTRTIAVDGIEPNHDTIARRQYPYVTEILVVTRQGLDAKAPAARLRNWLLSREGQAVVRESGYVPLSSDR